MFKGVDITSFDNNTKIGTTANGSQFNIGGDLNKISHRLAGFGEDIDGGYGHFGAEMSQDHYYGVLFGLFFIHKFVENDYVKPTANLRGFYLKDEMKTIVQRLSDHFASVKEAPVIGSTDDHRLDNIDKFFDAPWLMTNPDKENKIVSRGAVTYDGGFSFAIEKIAEEILGNDRYNLASGQFRLQKKGSQNEDIKNISNQENMFNNSLTFLKAKQDALLLAGLPFAEEYTGTGINVFNMYFKLGAMSKLYTSNEIANHADYIFQSKGFMWEMLYSVLNSERNVVVSSTEYRKHFDKLPCEIENRDNIKFKHIGLGKKWQLENKFNMYSGSIGEKGVFIQVGEFSGLDFMLLHNLYRIFFKDDIKNISYNDNSCLCSEKLYKYAFLDNNNQNISTISNVFDVEIMNLSYKDFNIPAPTWLRHNVNVISNGILNVKRDLSICNSTLTIENNGTVTTNIGSDGGHLNYIKVKKGSTLEIKSGGTLNIENNTKVVIEEGAKLVLNTGAIINLNGPNAVLEINEGQIVMAAGANVTIECGKKYISGSGTNKVFKDLGYLKIINNWTSDDKSIIVTENDNSALFIGQLGTTFDECAASKILQIHGNIGLVTDWQLGHLGIRNGFVAIDKGSQLVSNAKFTQIETVNVNYLTNANITNENRHMGISIPGRDNLFKDVVISNATYGIRFYNRGGQGRINLDHVEIKNNCWNGIMQLGGSFNIINQSHFSSNGYSVKTIGSSGLSIFRNSYATGASQPLNGEPFIYQGTGTIYGFKSSFSHGIESSLNIKDATLRLRCSYLDNSQVNLRFRNAFAIYMNPNAYNAFQEISNDFLGNKNEHIKGNGATVWGIDYGKNFFSRTGQYFNFDLRKGNVATVNPNTTPLWAIYAKENSMLTDDIKNLNGNTYPPLIPKPLSGFNYSLFYDNGIMVPGNVELLDYAPYTYTTNSFENDMNNYCNALGSGNSGIRKFNIRQGVKSDIGIPNTNTSNHDIFPALIRPHDPIRPWVSIGTGQTGTSLVVQKPMRQVIDINTDRIYNGESLRLDSAINELTFVINNNNSPVLNQAENKEGMQAMYKMLNDAYQFAAFDADSIAMATQTQAERVMPYYAQMNTTMQQLWVNAADANSIWHDIKYHIAIDWAQVHRTANNRVEALNVLNTTEIEITNPIENIGLNKWKCINQMEMALQADTTLSLDTALAMFPCVLEEPTEEYLDMLQAMYNNPEGNTGGGDYQMQNNSSINNTSIAKQLGIYPNPANNQITITVDKQKIENIMVYDMQGKLYINQTPNAINMYQLTINNLPEGIYSIVVKTNKTVYTQKITVIHP